MVLREIENLAFSPKGLSANFLGNPIPQKLQIMNYEFRYGIKNDTNKRVVYAITPGTFPTGIAGEQLLAIQKEHPQIDAIAGDGVIFQSVEDAETKECKITVAGNKTFEHFKSYSKVHVFLIDTIEMSSSDKNNLQSEVSFVKTNPFESELVKTARLAKWFSLAQQDQTRVIAKGINLPIGPDAIAFMTVEPNSEIDIVFGINVA